MDVGIFYHFFVFFSINGFIQQDIPARTVRKRYLTTEVAANLIHLLRDTGFIVDSELKSLDRVAPLKLKSITSNPTPSWRN